MGTLWGRAQQAEPILHLSQEQDSQGHWCFSGDGDGLRMGQDMGLQVRIDIWVQ